MSPRLAVAIGSTCSRPRDLSGNLAQVRGLARQAGALGVHVLLTPEMSASGYGGYPAVLALAEPAGDGPVFRGLADIAAESGVIVLAGFVERNGSLRHIAHYAVRPDGRYWVQRKHRVTPSEAPLDPAVPLVPSPDEDIGQVEPGTERFTSLEIEGVRCAMVICADWGIPHLDAALAGLGVRMVFLPTGAGGTRDQRVDNAELETEAGRETFLRMADRDPELGRRALACRRLGRGLATVNLAGFDGIRLYHGGSGSILSPAGDVLALVPACPNFMRAAPRLAFAEVDFGEAPGG